MTLNGDCVPLWYPLLTFTKCNYMRCLLMFFWRKCNVQMSGAFNFRLTHVVYVSRHIISLLIQFVHSRLCANPNLTLIAHSKVKMRTNFKTAKTLPIFPWNLQVDIFFLLTQPILVPISLIPKSVFYYFPSIIMYV